MTTIVWGSPTWVRTRTLLIQSQPCCQLHHRGKSKESSHPPPLRQRRVQSPGLTVRGISLHGGRGRIRTDDLWIMSPAS